MSMRCPLCDEPMSEGNQRNGVVKFKCDMEYTDGSMAGCSNEIIITSKFKRREEVMITKLTQFQSWKDEMFIPFTVDEISFTQGTIKYSLTGDENSIAWVYEGQLQSIEELLKLGIIEEE